MSKESNDGRPLLFINQDSTKPTPAQITSLRSYVHGTHRRWEKKSRVKTTSKVLTQDSTPPDRSDTPNRLRSFEKRNQMMVRAGQGYDQSTPEASVPSPRPWHGNSDPFAQAVFPITPETNFLLRQAHRFEVFSSYPLKASRRFREKWDEDMHRAIRDAVSEAAGMNTILASGCYVASHVGNREIMEHKALRHKLEGIRRVRQALLADPEADVMFPVFKLIALEFTIRDYEAARQHLNALRQILRSQTTNRYRDILSTRALVTLHTSDVWIASCLCQHTQISIDEWDAGLDDRPKGHPVAPKLYQKPVMRRCLDVATGDTFFANLADAFEHMRWLKKRAFDVENDVEQEKLVVWLHFRWNALSGRMLNRFLDEIEHDVDTINFRSLGSLRLLRAAVCLAYLVYNHLEFTDSRLPYSSSQQKMFLQFEPILKQLLNQHIAFVLNIDEKLLLWLLFMASINHEMLQQTWYSATPRVQASWSSSMFFHTVSRLGMEADRWEYIRPVLRDFLYKEESEHLFLGKPRHLPADFAPWPPVWMNVMGLPGVHHAHHA